MTKLEELKAKHTELKAQILTESKTCFNEMTTALFQKYPALESFSWQQYTPYFNDGDECTFSAHTDDLDFLFDGKEFEGVSSYCLTSEYRKDEFTEEGRMAFADTIDLVKQLDSDTLKEMFGDHCRVSAKRAGVEVEQYDHD